MHHYRRVKIVDELNPGAQLSRVGVVRECADIMRSITLARVRIETDAAHLTADKQFPVGSDSLKSSFYYVLS